MNYINDERRKELAVMRLLTACRVALELGTLAERFTPKETKEMLESALFVSRLSGLDRILSD